MCVCVANKEGLSAGFTPQWKSPVWLYTQPVAPVWLSDACASYTLPSTCASISGYPDSMYVQNVKTGSLFISRRSCLFSYIDASGVQPNMVVSDLNCLPTFTLGPKSVRTIRKSHIWQWITNSGVNPRDHVQLHIVNIMPQFLYFCSLSVSCPPQISAFHWTSADSCDSVRRRGGAGRVCVFHGTTKAFINKVRVYVFFTSPPPRYSFAPFCSIFISAVTLS